VKRISVITLVLVFAMASSVLAADKNIEAQNILVGGAADFGFGMGTTTATPEEGDDVETKTTEFGLNGYMGYFVVDGFEVGPILGINNDKTTVVDGGVDGDFVTSTTTYRIGLQVGYFFDLDSIAVPYGMLALGFLGGSSSMDNGDTEATSSISGYGFGPKVGANIFFTEAIALDLGLFMDYDSYTQTVDAGGDDSEEYDLDTTDVNYGLAVGFNVFF
jgi:Outer membrane protein beta-barrel domain